MSAYYVFLDGRGRRWLTQVRVPPASRRDVSAAVWLDRYRTERARLNHFVCWLRVPARVARRLLRGCGQ